NKKLPAIPQRLTRTGSKLPAERAGPFRNTRKGLAADILKGFTAGFFKGHRSFLKGNVFTLREGKRRKQGKRFANPETSVNLYPLHLHLFGVGEVTTVHTQLRIQHQCLIILDVSIKERSIESRER